MGRAKVTFEFSPTNRNFEHKPSFENQLIHMLDGNYIKLVSNSTPDRPHGDIFYQTMYGDTLYFDTTYELLINSECMYVKRSFCRGKFLYGGRFYTPVFQGIPSTWRHTIKINDEPTVELDYSAHHIRLLYHEEGIDYQGEPYVYKKDDKENADKRIINKYIAMIAINALNKSQAIKAIRTAIIQDKDNEKYKGDIPSEKSINDSYREFVNHHKPISKYINNDAGIKLQRKDSDIMNDILVQLSLNKIIGLPIHDSIITNFKYKNILKQEMTNQYFKLTNFKPIVT
jgi:hypothetical protein